MISSNKSLFFRMADRALQIAFLQPCHCFSFVCPGTGQNFNTTSLNQSLTTLGTFLSHQNPSVFPGHTASKIYFGKVVSRGAEEHYLIDAVLTRKHGPDFDGDMVPKENGEGCVLHYISSHTGTCNCTCSFRFSTGCFGI